MLPKLVPNAPSKVVFHVGTNNWANNESNDQIARKFDSLILHARKVLPSAKLIISGILVRRDTSLDDIRLLNGTIVKACNKPGVVFVDANVDHKTRNWLGKDGLHLNRFGVKSLSDVFVRSFSKNW